MKNQRVHRVREEIKKEASAIIRQMKDPRVGFVSVTDVDVSGDLQQAKIYVSVYGDDDAKASSLQGLQAAQGFIRSEIGKVIRLRHTPDITFHLDSSLEHGARINQIIESLSAEAEDKAPIKKSGDDEASAETGKDQ